MTLKQFVAHLHVIAVRKPGRIAIRSASKSASKPTGLVASMVLLYEPMAIAGGQFETIDCPQFPDVAERLLAERRLPLERMQSDALEEIA